MRVLLIVTCVTLEWFILSIKNNNIEKALGKKIIATDLPMNKGEVFDLMNRLLVALVLDLIFCFEKISNRYILIIVNCVVSLYMGFCLYSLLFYKLYKNKLGAYENGIVAYDGMMLYKNMEKYSIVQSHYNKYYSNILTIYCKPTLATFNLSKHFDIKSEQLEEYKKLFKYKHNQIKELKK